jgi:hypothetical protein
MIDLKLHFRAVASLRDKILHDRAQGADAPYIAQQTDKLTSLVQDVTLSVHYVRMHKAVLSEMAHRLKNDLRFINAAREWNYLSLDSRCDVLTHFVHMQAEAQRDISGLRVHGPALIGAKDLETVGLARSSLDDKTGAQDTFLSQDTYLDNAFFDEAIHNAAHEQTHIFHTWLARAFVAGQISPLDPIYRDCETIAMAKRMNAYISCNLSQAYNAQFEEKDAEQAGYAMRACARQTMYGAAPYQPSVGLMALGIGAIVCALATSNPGPRRSVLQP